MMRREAFMWVLEQYHGTWYKWGGDDPAAFDCSGLVVEGLKSVGLLDRNADYSAASLWKHLKDHGAHDVPLGTATRGCIVFYGTASISHVEVIWERWDADVVTIGASGGGSKTLTVEDAMRDNAFVKLRKARPDVLAVLDPWA